MKVKKIVVSALTLAVVVSTAMLVVADPGEDSYFEITAPHGTFEHSSLRIGGESGEENYTIVEASKVVLEKKWGWEDKVKIDCEDFVMTATEFQTENVWIRAYEIEMTAVLVIPLLHIHIVGGELVEPGIIPEWLLEWFTGIMPSLTVSDFYIKGDIMYSDSGYVTDMEISGT